MISTKFKAASSHLKFEIRPSFRRRRRNVPILNVLLFNLMFQSYKLEENMSLAKEGLEKGMKEENEGELKRSPGA